MSTSWADCDDDEEFVHPTWVTAELDRLEEEKKRHEGSVQCLLANFKQAEKKTAEERVVDHLLKEVVKATLAAEDHPSEMAKLKGRGSDDGCASPSGVLSPPSSAESTPPSSEDGSPPSSPPSSPRGPADPFAADVAVQAEAFLRQLLCQPSPADIDDSPASDSCPSRGRSQLRQRHQAAQAASQQSKLRQAQAQRPPGHRGFNAPGRSAPAHAERSTAQNRTGRSYQRCPVSNARQVRIVEHETAPQRGYMQQSHNQPRGESAPASSAREPRQQRRRRRRSPSSRGSAVLDLPPGVSAGLRARLSAPDSGFRSKARTPAQTGRAASPMPRQAGIYTATVPDSARGLRPSSRSDRSSSQSGTGAPMQRGRNASPMPSQLDSLRGQHQALRDSVADHSCALPQKTQQSGCSGGYRAESSTPADRQPVRVQLSQKHTFSEQPPKIGAQERVTQSAAPSAHDAGVADSPAAAVSMQQQPAGVQACACEKQCSEAATHAPLSASLETKPEPQLNDTHGLHITFGTWDPSILEGESDRLAAPARPFADSSGASAEAAEVVMQMSSSAQESDRAMQLESAAATAESGEPALASTSDLLATEQCQVLSADAFETSRPELATAGSISDEQPSAAAERLLSACVSFHGGPSAEHRRFSLLEMAGEVVASIKYCLFVHGRQW